MERFLIVRKPRTAPVKEIVVFWIEWRAVQRLTTGGVVAWDQGTRGSWDVSSFVRFHSVAELGQRPPQRVPFGVLPVSLVEVDDNLFSVGPENGEPLYSNRTVLLEP